MNTKTTRAARNSVLDSDADIDRCLAEHHEEVAAKLAAANDQIARVEAALLEELLREARARR